MSLSSLKFCLTSQGYEDMLSRLQQRPTINYSPEDQQEKRRFRLLRLKAKRQREADLRKARALRLVRKLKLSLEDLKSPEWVDTVRLIAVIESGEVDVSCALCYVKEAGCDNNFENWGENGLLPVEILEVHVEFTIGGQELRISPEDFNDLLSLDWSIWNRELDEFDSELALANTIATLQEAL